MAVGAGTEWWGTENLQRFVMTTMHGDVALAQVAADMRDDVLQLRRYEKDVLLNVASPEIAESYRAKWDRAFLDLRYDLVRARALAPATSSGALQAFENSLAFYRTGFVHTYELLRAGKLTTAQQANTEMTAFKANVHVTEEQAESIKLDAERRISNVDAVLDAKRYDLGLWVMLLTAMAVLSAGLLIRSYRTALTDRYAPR
jgi:methyl-accepting chemotaxis protein